MRKLLLLAVAVHLAAGGAMGGLVDETGMVTDWGLTPFTRPNQVDTYDGTHWMTVQNDYAPIDYPGVGYEPSPGGSSGEPFDLEEMHVRAHGGQVQVLVVTGGGPAMDAVGSTWYLGDLMLTADGQDFGIVTSSGGQGLTPGSVYRLDTAGDAVPLQDASRSYLGDTRLRANDYGAPATVADVAGPWAVSASIDAAQLLGTASIETDTFDYGGSEDATFLIQYTFAPSVLGLDAGGPDQWSAKMTWGCGNDVIRVRGDDPYVPEPATYALLMVGAALTFWARRHPAGRRPD